MILQKDIGRLMDECGVLIKSSTVKQGRSLQRTECGCYIQKMGKYSGQCIDIKNSFNESKRFKSREFSAII